MLDWKPLLPFDLSVINTLNAEPGVFRLSYKSADDKNYVFYVGRADMSLKTELQKIRTRSDNQCIKTHLDNLECYFRFAYLPSEVKGIDAERTLYEKYKPRCNLSVPEGQIIELNLN